MYQETRKGYLYMFISIVIILPIAYYTEYLYRIELYRYMLLLFFLTELIRCNYSWSIANRMVKNKNCYK